MSETTEYQFSESALRARRNLLLILTLMLPVLVFVFVAVSNPLGPMSLSETFRMILTVMVILVVVFGLMAYFVGGATQRRLRDLKVRLSPDHLERIGGRFSEQMLYGDIQKVQIVEQYRKGIAFLKLSGGGRTLILAGFEQSDKLWERIKAKLPATAVIEKKIRRIDWEHPFPVLGLTALITFVFLAVTRMHPMLDKHYTKFFNIAFAVYLLSYRPISKSQGARFRSWEIGLGVFLLLLSGLSLFLWWLE